jgi:Holliday junction resolvase
MMTTQPESRLSRKIMDKLREQGIFCFKIHGGPTMMAGLPDIIACVDGRFYGLETKMPQQRDNISVRQQYVHDQIRQAHGLVAVVCSPQEALDFIKYARINPTE